jgi:hypothetical protein
MGPPGIPGNGPAGACPIFWISAILNGIGPAVTVHGSRVASVQKRIEPQKSFSGASVDQTRRAQRLIERNCLCRVTRLLSKPRGFVLRLCIREAEAQGLR